LKKNYNKLIYFIAGEPSGDLHGSNVLRELNILNEEIKYRGLGGPFMQKQGLHPIADFSRLSIMGFSEVINELPFFIKLKKLVIKDISIHRPSKIVLVDYPGFNLKIAQNIKKKFSNIDIVYYISPQLWAWKEGRINIIKKYIDKMIVIFPFEVSWYEKRGVDVKYFGHPLIDIHNQQQIIDKNTTKKTIGIFPGSRPQEIKRHIPVLKDVIASIQKTRQDIKFIIGLAPGVSKKIISSLGLKKNFQIIQGNSFVGFELSDVAIVASGTATLECAITKTPCVVIYKTSIINWLIASFFMNVKFISIVNILGGKFIFSELLQNKCVPHLIVKKTFKLLNQNNKGLKQDLQSIVGSLGGGDSYIKTAKYILNH